MIEKQTLLISFQVWWLKNSHKYSIDDPMEKIADDFLKEDEQHCSYHDKLIQRIKA